MGQRFSTFNSTEAGSWGLITTGTIPVSDKGKDAGNLDSSAARAGDARSDRA